MGRRMTQAAFARLARTNPTLHREICRRGGVAAAAKRAAEKERKEMEADVLAEVAARDAQKAQGEDITMWERANYLVLPPNPNNPSSSPLYEMK